MKSLRQIVAALFFVIPILQAIGQDLPQCSVQNSEPNPQHFDAPPGWQEGYDIKFKIRFHQWVTNSAETQLAQSEKDYLIGRLNSYFAPARISFEEKVGSFDFRVNKTLANESTFFSIGSSDYTSDAIDIFLVNKLEGTMSVATLPYDAYWNSGHEAIILQDSVYTWEYVQNPGVNDKRLVSTYRVHNESSYYSNQNYASTTIAHEMGHILGLFHTHDELVWALVDGSNCDIASDLICVHQQNLTKIHMV